MSDPVVALSKAVAKDAVTRAAWDKEVRDTPEDLRERLAVAICNGVDRARLTGLEAQLDRIIAAIPPPTEKCIHSMAGSIGADWGLDGALEFIDAAEEVVWVSSMFRHDLLVFSGGRSVAFDVKRPDRDSLQA